MEDRRRGWVALGLLFAAHPRYKSHIRLQSVSPGDLFGAAPGALETALSLRPQEAQDIFSRNFPDWAEKEIKAAGKEGVAILTFDDAGYPPGLRNLPDPPPILYVKGQIEPDDSAAVAVVGSRKATPYGLRVAGDLGKGLAAEGLAVVSGLARGIDTAAHRGAIDAGGRTVGVLGSGIDVVYPKENRLLFEQVSSAGAVVTEFPFGTAPHAFHFPVRNRIIAALSGAVVVVEAARGSGSLITAKLAADEMGLPVCAVPGAITSTNSQGCNDLIYDGATPVRDVRDILEQLPVTFRQRASEIKQARAADPQRARVSGLAPRDLGRDARAVLRHLAPDEPKSVDELASSLKLATAALLGHLLELEIKGLASQLPGGLYVRKS